MNIAIIIAGGSGHRMGQDIPKQFINVYDKPVIIYTLEGFQRHPMIDAIEVVCIDGWHDVLWAYAHQFDISKLKWVVSGGGTGQESIRNGVYNLEGKANDDDIIIIHDGIRPLVDDSVLTDVIQKAKNGQLRGWSFGFMDREVEQKRDEDGIPLRDVKDMDLREVSLLDNTKTPAYDGTLVAVRSDDVPVYIGESFDDEIHVREEKTEEVPEQQETAEEINYDEVKKLINDMKN
jgi:CTP:molybdopterin cytidylyltransferase MocA